MSVNKWVKSGVSVTLAGLLMVLAGCNDGVSGKYTGKWKYENPKNDCEITISREGDHYLIVTNHQNDFQFGCMADFPTATEDKDGYFVEYNGKPDNLGSERVYGMIDKDTLFNVRQGKDEKEFWLHRVK